jgi:dihydropyrimidine dehydrogenase (NAD+) subunit PreT
MASLRPDRAEVVFDDFKAPFDADQAVAEANRCLYCYDAPCMHACPTHIDIAGFIRKIATDNVKGSARTILDANILGHSCARVCPVEVLCVGACVHNHHDHPPIQIGKLQRYATDAAVSNGWRFFKAGASTGKRVAIVGGGPAGLAAAHELRIHGHAVTILERTASLGGLNVTGVAPYKLRTDAALEEVDYVLGIGGIEVKTGVDVDAASLSALVGEFDAVFVAIGLGPDSTLGIPGESIPGISGAVRWIEGMKAGPLDLSGVTHAAVIGGGNTAMDAVRELKGLGIANVTLVYRGAEANMSGYAHEWEAAVLDGVAACWQAQPVAFEGQAHVTGVRCLKTDADKKPVAGTEFTVPAQLVLVATGQARIGQLLAGLPGVVLERGRVVADADGRTGHARVFVGGDCANGGKEVVNAAAEGKKAARAIHAALSGGSNG